MFDGAGTLQLYIKQELRAGYGLKIHISALRACACARARVCVFLRELCSEY